MSKKDNFKQKFVRSFITWKAIILNGLVMSLAFGFAHASSCPRLMYALIIMLLPVFSIQLWIRFTKYNALFII